MKNKIVKDIMVPLSEYVIVSEEESIRGALAMLRDSHAHMPPDAYYHRAVLVKNDAGEIVGKLGYHGFLEALDPKYDDLEEMKTIAGSGITQDDLKEEMDKSGLWNNKLPMVKQNANELKMKEVMIEFAEHIEEDSSLLEAMHQIVKYKVLSLLTTRNDEVTGIIRMSDLFEEITDYIISED